MGLDTFEVIERIEHYFQINISDVEAAQLGTVQEIIDVVVRKIKDNPHSHSSYLLLEGTEHIESRVIEIISDISGISISKIKRHHSLTRDLGLD